MIRRILLILCCGASLWVQAQIAGSSSFAHLSQGGSARLVGLGWAALAHPGDVGFSAFNPALLTAEHQGELSITSQASLGGFRSGSLTYGLPTSTPGTLQPLLVRDAQRGWSVGGRPHITWALGVDYGHTGALEERDAAGELIGTFAAGQVTPRMAMGVQWQGLALGLGTKVSMLTFGPYTAQALAADLGWIWTGDSGQTSFGMVVRNAGRSIEYFSDAREPLPLDVQFVLSQKLRHAPFRWNVAYSHVEQWDLRYSDPQLITKDPLTGVITVEPISGWNNVLRHLHPSVEAQLGGRLFFQVGYDVRRQMEMRLPTRRSNPGLSFGVSVQTRKMAYQFGSAVYHVAGRLNQCSLIRRF